MNITEDMRISANMIAEEELYKQGAEFDLVPQHIQMSLLVERILELEFWEKNEELSDEDQNEIAMCYYDMLEDPYYQDIARESLELLEEAGEAALAEIQNRYDY